MVQKTSKEKSQGQFEISSTNTFLYEWWDTFLAPGSSLNKKYSVVTDRLGVSLRYKNSWMTLNATVNAVHFLKLPENTSFGSAFAYYSNGGNREKDIKVYLRHFNFTFKRIGSEKVSGVFGRFDYSNGSEWKGSNKIIEWLKMNRIAERLFGLPNWTMYQRSMNGFIIMRDSGRFHSAFSAWMPTAGTYSKQAGDIMNDLKVITLAGTYKFDTLIPNQEIQMFCYNYDDKRPVIAARPDNAVSGAKQTPKISTDGINVDIMTYGFSTLGVYNFAKGILDTLLWVAYQSGKWYELMHKARGVAFEVGYQWPKVCWTPWLRLGINQYSGDSDSEDGLHETFFMMLPSRRYFNCNAYNQMNLKDTLMQLLVKPNSKLQVRFDYNKLRLSESADRWYAGGGAMANTGTTNGITARKTGNKSKLGSVIGCFGTYMLGNNSKINIYTSYFKGDEAVEATFADSKNQRFSYFEVVLGF